MEEKWVPPSDAVEIESNEEFTPPSDAIEVSPVKKKVDTVSEPLVKPLAKKSETSPSPYAPESLQSKSDGSTSVSDGLSSDSKSLPKIKGEAASKLKEVDNQIRVVSKKWNDLDRAYKQQQAELKNYEDQVNDPMVSDQAKAQLIDQYKALSENSKSVYSEMEKVKQSAIKLQQAKQTLGKIEKVDSDLKLKKESLGSEMFDALARGSASLGSSIAKTPAFLYDIASLPQNYYAETYPEAFGWMGTSSEKFAENLDLPENKIAQYYDKAVEDSRAKFAQKYDKPITEYIDNGEYANALKSLSIQVSESTPVTLSLMMGGMAGASSTATTMGGGLVFGADKKSQLDKENPDMKETAKTLNALSTGLMEGVFETYGITKLGSIIKNVAASEGKEAAAQIAKKGFMEVYAPVLKKYAGVAGEEMTGEMATQFTQNAIDKYSGAKPDIDLMDGVIDAGLVGLASSGVYSSPVAVVDLVKTGKQKDVYNQAMELKQDPDKIQTIVQSVGELVDQGKITQEDADKFVGKLDDMMKVDEKVPDYVKGDERAKAVELILERDDIQKSIASLEPAMVTEKAKRIAEINSELNLISKNAERVQMERKQFNTEKNTIQEQETASILQREQGEIGETGSERGGVEQIEQGKKAASTSEKEEVKPTTEELIAKRKKETEITDKQKAINDLVFSVNDYNKLKNGRLGKDKPEGRKVKNEIITRAKEMGYVVEEYRDSIRLKTPQGTKVRFVMKNENNKALSDSNNTLDEKAPETQEFFNRLNDIGLNAFPTIYGMDGKRMNQRQLETAISDVANGLRSNGAHELLNQLEGMRKSGTIELMDPNTREKIEVPYDIFMESFKDMAEEEYQMSEEEFNQLAQEYDDYYNSLTPEQQENEITAINEGAKGEANAPTETVSEDQTIDGREKESPAEGEVITPKEYEGEEKEAMLGKRALAEDAEGSQLTDEQKEAIKGKGITYIERKLNAVQSEVDELISAYEKAGLLDALMGYALNTENRIKPDVRTVLLKELYSKYAELSKIAKTEEDRIENGNKALDVFDFARKFATELGQGVNAQKEWQKILGKSPELAVLAAQKEVDKRNASEMEDKEKVITDSKKALEDFLKTDEGKVVIEDFVKKEVRNKKSVFKQTKEERAATKKDLLEKWKSLGNNKSAPVQQGFGLTDEHIKIAVKLGSIYLADGYANFKSWSKKMMTDLGFTEAQAKWLWDNEKVEDTDKTFAQASEEINKIKVERLKKKLADIEKLMSDPKKVLAELEKKREALEKNKDKSDEVKDLENKISEKRKQLRDLENELSPIKKELNESDLEQEKIEKLRQKAKDIDALISDPQKVLADLEKRKEEAEKRADKSDEVKELENDIKQKKKLVKFIEKLEGMSDDQKRQILADSADYIIKNGYLSDVAFRNIFAKSLGLEYIDEAAVERIKGLSQTISDVDTAAENYLKEPTKENAKAYRKAVYKARIANNQLSEYFKGKHTWGGLAKSFIQGNLLTIRSLVQNPAYNILNMPTMFMVNSTASAMDYLLSKAAKIEFLHRMGLDEKRTIDVIAAQKGYYTGFGRGVAEGVKQTVTGSLADDLYERDINAALHPKEALLRTFTEKEKPSQKIKSFVEGVFGIAPEAAFRVLNMGDKPFRRGAETARLAEIVTANIDQRKRELEKKAKLTPEEETELADIKSGVAYDTQMLLPSPEVLAEIEQAGLVATYQQKNAIASALQRMLATDKNKVYKNKFHEMAETGAKSLGKLLLTTQAPYVQTPLNVAAHAFFLTVPTVSFAKAGLLAAQGDRRGALKMTATGLTGMMIAFVAGELIKSGVITGDADEEDEKKEKDFRRLYEYPRNINIDLLQRILNGEPNDGWQPGDYTFDYSRTGLMGAIMYAHAQMAKDYSQEQLDEMSFLEKQLKLSLGSLKSTFDQSFLAGTNQLFNAFQDGGWAMDKWLISTAGALKAIAIPNTVTQFSNIAGDNLYKDTRDEDVTKAIKNTFKDQLFMGGDLPNKITIWGEPIKKTPEGRSAWAYQLFDFTKGAPRPENQFGEELYRLWKDSKSNEVIPSAPQRNVTINNEKMNLDAKQYEVLATAVGKARKSLVEWYLNSDEWKEDSNEVKIDKLKAIYADGYKSGLEKFKNVTGMDKESEKVRRKKNKAVEQMRKDESYKGLLE